MVAIDFARLGGRHWRPPTMDDPIGALTSYVAFLFSTTVHEAAQAILVAWRVFDEIFMPIFFFAVDRLYPERVYG